MGITNFSSENLKNWTHWSRILISFCAFAFNGKMLFRLLVTMTLQFAIALYDMHEYDYTTVRRNVGYVNGLFYISLHIIPLAKVSSIINTTHRTEGLSYVGILSSFIVTFFWSIGGIFDWNPYVRVPNIVCCLYSIRVIELYIRHSRRRR
ncbi:uncharacterized protein [Anabrus simplex]|uniref:uncharacterized protein isoform X2 n=1 Tax=Anabrus simplex TaxID=316456 RepID=UPI0035A34A4C